MTGSSSLRHPPRQKRMIVPTRMLIAFMLSIIAGLQLLLISNTLQLTIEWNSNFLPASRQQSLRAENNKEGCKVGKTSQLSNGRSSTSLSSSHEKVVVVYSGPTSMNADEGKNWMYLKNFEYFLDHGLDCLAQDTILVLTKEVATHFQQDIADRRRRCDAHRRQVDDSSRASATSSVRVLEREDKCYDMESFRVALEQVDLSTYEYLVYLNCGVVGPKIKESDDASSLTSPWTRHFTSMLSSTVKMSGLTINCVISPHVQSMIFAVDQVGLQVIRKSGAVYDCGESNAAMSDEAKSGLIKRYEVGMGRAILDAGYHLKSSHGTYGAMEIRPQDLDADLGWCSYDTWYIDKLRVAPETRWEDFVFFKTSRMFLLPGMKEEIDYGDDHYLALLMELPGPDNERRGMNPHRNELIKSNMKFDYLWDGGTRLENPTMVDPQSIRVSIVVSHCRGDLSWVQDYLDGFPYHSITVVSKCGENPDDRYLPSGTKYMVLDNVGRIDHTMAYWMSNVIPKQDVTEKDVVLFLKDNLFQQPPHRRRTIGEMMAIVYNNDFACLQKPIEGMSQYHLSEALKLFNMTFYQGLPKYRPDGSRILNSNEAFKSKYKNLGEWMESLGLLWHSEVVPVCYGGSYATKVSRVSEVPLKVRQELERSLSRADNIEEGHFAERFWASLFSSPLSMTQTKYLLSRAKEVNWAVNKDGGGVLGALEEWNVMGSVQTASVNNTDLYSWTKNKKGQWQWPQKYQAKVIDYDNFCIRPIVEPDIPDITTKNSSDPEAAPSTVAMCSIATKSDLRYINEWLDYHIVHGFAHFFLYDSQFTPRLEGYLNATRPGWFKYISVAHWPGARSQKTVVWSQCADKIRARTAGFSWIANLDVDEFLVLWRDDHVVPLLERKCKSGSIQIASYNFAPDDLTTLQRKLLSQHDAMLNEQDTYAASANLSPFGLPSPLLLRNGHCGALGYNGRKRSTERLQTKTIAKSTDLVVFEPLSHFPVLSSGTYPKSPRGNILNTTWPSPDQSGVGYASIFRYPFKSIPEYIYQHCHSVGSDLRYSHTDDVECEKHRTLALNPNTWAPYHEDHDHKAWRALKRKIPWYGRFDDLSSTLPGGLAAIDSIDCPKFHPWTQNEYLLS